LSEFRTDHGYSLARIKAVLEKYLQTLAQVPLQDKLDICLFFNSNVVSDRQAPVANPAYKAGYLTKKGRNFGGWQTRYYVLKGPELAYYENVGGFPFFSASGFPSSLKS
jgi:RalA-binding protein 1